MIRREELWARVQRALDDRRDPLADARVQALLAERPEERAEVERTAARLSALGAPAVRRRRPAAAVAGFALAGAALLAWWIARGAPVESVDPTGEGSRSRVLSLRMTSELRDADGARFETRAFDDGARRITARIATRATDTRPARTSATLVAWTETETRP